MKTPKYSIGDKVFIVISYDTDYCHVASCRVKAVYRVEPVPTYTLEAGVDFFAAVSELEIYESKAEANTAAKILHRKALADSVDVLIERRDKLTAEIKEKSKELQEVQRKLNELSKL